MTKPRLFLSHTATETELAQLLKQHISRDFLGLLDIFVSSDGTTIRAGSDWFHEVSTALSQAKIEIVLCSHDSVRRPWVNFEAGAGWIRGIRVIPVCHLGLKPSDLPMPLSALESIDATKAGGLRKLYEAIAHELEMQAPAADFEMIATTIVELERTRKRRDGPVTNIEHPRILCAATNQWAEMDFHLDCAVLEKAFPTRVTVEPKITSSAVRRLLTTARWDIIHLVAAVNADTGELIFSQIDPRTYQPHSSVDEDKMAPEEFAALLSEAQTRLVVLATRNALLLAVEVGRATNMIGTNIEISGKAMALWAEVFYDLLARGYPLFRAYELTKASARAPMKLVRHDDVAFIAGSQATPAS
jgi:hypothetical protein